MDKKSERLFWANNANETEFEESGTPTLQQLIDLLRSDEPLTKRERDWLADLFDVNSNKTRRRVQLVTRRRGPKKDANFDRNWNIYMFMRDLVDRGVKVEAAVQEAILEFPRKDGKFLTRSGIMGVWDKMSKDLEDVSAINASAVADAYEWWKRENEKQGIAEEGNRPKQE